jgi:hypothetical protein
VPRAHRKGKVAPGAAPFDLVRSLARELPGAEESTSYGTPALKVKGRLFARLWEDGETLVLRTTPEDRAHLLATWPRQFFLTDHYRDHPWVLARLRVVPRARLAEVLRDAWRRVAPRADGRSGGATGAVSASAGRSGPARSAPAARRRRG